ncbi:HD domain-containing protein [Ferrimonas senticii]|uniref:HD domain-containing protein n=1 Tax=Ferrimonas senticii TaxID=394566 RepID=UPI000410E282|nr:HD domain-containing protein [Ferrimonas senticii]
MNQLDGILQFLMAIEQLKAVERKSRPVGLNRLENSAEHSWHVCLLAMTLAQYANQAVDVNKMIKMMLLHDLGEIGAGDKIVYASENASHKQAELSAFHELLTPLPASIAAEMLALYQEFNLGESPEACFAKAIDRVPPLLQNLNDNGFSWQRNNISKAQVFELNQRHISAGSKALWNNLEAKLQQAVEQGILS